MIKVVIADDETLILKNLQLIIPWADLGCKVAGTAKNGQEAYVLCEQYEADLLLTDISMPGMTGLELLKKLQQLPKKPISILISGYDEFEYAREGLKYSALDYILKPIDYDELQQCIQRAIAQIKEKSGQEHEIEKQRLYEAMITGITNKESRVFKKPFVPLLIQRQQQDVEAGFSLFSDVQGKQYQFTLSPVQFVILLEWPPDDRHMLLDQVQKKIEEQNTVLIGHPIYSEYELKPVLKQLAEWMEVHNLIEESVLLVEDAEKKYQSKKSAADSIGNVLSFIEAQFYEDISAEQAAAYAGMSVSYFSLLFKQITGSTFLDYVTCFRIEKACRLLTQTQLKTYEIAGKVGYTDARYFSQVFKKRMNLTPSEYRKQYAN